ncbi:preprotein translocase subunit SecA [Chloroflexota bacterium]
MLKWLGGLVDSNEKQLKKLKPLVEKLNELEPEFERLSDEELRLKTDDFKARLGAGRSLDDILPEAFATVREAAKRTIGQRHFDAQLIGGIVLHQGRIAEMKTGEGKTLAATLPLYLNALTGQGCHLVTVNDYLAKRDAHWMGPIYNALGISVACIHSQTPDNRSPSFKFDTGYESEDPRWSFMRPVSRRQAYEADITYGTNNEFGFDYLRDNMVLEQSQRVQRPLYYAIVDEVDNILIDEARTPLIISGAGQESLEEYQVFARIAARLKPGQDYEFDEKTRVIEETDSGYSIAESTLRREGTLKKDERLHGEEAEVNVPPHILALQNKLKKALVAKEAYRKDREYVVKDNQVIIVDEFTGRLMFGRRYADGLHQAIEAKENVKIQQETMTFATITFQNYFRMYHKLAGMTGTAITEAEEFHKIYQLEAVVIPSNKPLVRQDHPDRIYRDEKAKFNAVVTEIEELHKQGRPVLVGTVSVEKSELLSELLKRKGIPHQILNAKQHEKEAGIIAQAGRPGAVTVATNMAGRGVDIVLGDQEPDRSAAKDERAWERALKEWQQNHARVIELGGLHILGTERHEARRIDNQLRGRAGRQGDPGSSRFYVSLGDDVVRRFGGERIKGFMQWAGMDESTAIENRLVNRTIENAQVRVEGYHFDIRKHLVEYDDVVNKHREVIYSERDKMLSGADLKSNILSMISEELQEIVTVHTGNDHGVDYNIDGLINEVSAILPLPPALSSNALAQMQPGQITEELIRYSEALYAAREKETGAGDMRTLERLIMLRIVDNLWVQHLTAMEHMRQGIGLQAVAQRDPLVAYKREGSQMFNELLDNIRRDVVHTIYHVGITRQQAPKEGTILSQAAGDRSAREQTKPGGRKTGRNDPCPCGSGKKYKHCCGK